MDTKWHWLVAMTIIVIIFTGIVYYLPPDPMVYRVYVHDTKGKLVDVYDVRGKEAEDLFRGKTVSDIEKLYKREVDKLKNKRKEFHSIIIGGSR